MEFTHLFRVLKDASAEGREIEAFVTFATDAFVSNRKLTAAGCGNTVFYFEAKLPWEIPEWMPKTKDKAKAVINEFVSVLLQQDFKASFDEIL